MSMKYPYRDLGVPFDRNFRNDLNANFDDIEHDIRMIGGEAAQQALEAAEEANTQAIYAQTSGDYANDKGDYAAQQGDYAKTQGDYAKAQGDAANLAATNANDAANNANSAATNANNAATAANNAATNANTAADNANNATTNANIAADNANTQATNAQNAAQSANEAATNANDAADNANTQATYAQQQGDYAKEQGDYAKQVGDENKTRWLTAVNTYADIATTYPNPQLGDTVQTIDDSKIYRWDGTQWVWTQQYNANAITDVQNKIGILSDSINETKRVLLKPYFVEYFASFNKYGFGVPSGIANYPDGNYVLNVSGNAGDTFLTVTGGNIADAGQTTKWACVIRNDDGIYDLNKVMGTDGVNRVFLLKPLKKNITNGILANLHNAALGQHYTEHGYFAFAQHLYFSIPRYCERNEVLSQFLGSYTTGKWVINGTYGYSNTANIKTADGTLKQIGTKNLYLYAADGTKYMEWEEQLQQKKGYVESFIGCDSGSARVEFYLDDVLVDTKQIDREVERVIFPFEYANKGKIKIIPLGGFPQFIRVGNTTWFLNQKYSPSTLLKPNMKVVYIGDSWGTFHNQATTRELDRLMRADGGTPTILNFSRAGHSSDYAKEGFMKYVVDNKPDVVIIEYFTNDFNSIDGADLGTFVATDGTNQDMNIASLNEYVQNIQWMIDKAIEYGIQPIVVMPCATESESQTQSFADKAVQIWNGSKITNDNPYFQAATLGKAVTNSIEANGNADITIKAKSINSSARKGVIMDSDVNLTGGDIAGFYNNGTRKAGVRHNGTIDAPYIALQPRSFLIPANETNRGMMYLKDDSGSLDDALYIVIQKGDGTYVTKKIQLIDP